MSLSVKVCVCLEVKIVFTCSVEKFSQRGTAESPLPSHTHTHSVKLQQINLSTFYSRKKKKISLSSGTHF